MPRYTRFAALAVSFCLAPLGACTPEHTAGDTPARAAAASPPAPQEIVVRAFDYQFEAPDTIEGGPTTLRLINDGPDFHHIWLVRLEEGKTVRDLMTHLARGHGPMPSWAIDVGGPNTPGAPGEETAAMLDLKPGNYAMICVIPAMTDGQPHVMKGMVRPLTVLPAAGAPRAMFPEAELVMTLDDYSFELDSPIRSGTHTIRVENVAAQAHEVLVVKLEPGKTATDFLSFLQNPEGPLPGKPIGGVTGLAQGESNLITLEFEPGDYALICFVPDVRDGAPHFVHGMMEQFHVG